MLKMMIIMIKFNI